MKRNYLTLNQVRLILNISYPTALRMVRDELKSHRLDEGATARWLIDPDSVQAYIDKERQKVDDMQRQFNEVTIGNDSPTN